MRDSRFLQSRSLAERLVSPLPSGCPGLFNPWADTCPDDLEGNGPEEKLDRLGAHLACDPLMILVGEAPGYQGCRHSGIAFTSERLLMENRIPRMAPLPGRLTHRERPFSEPSATIVWKALVSLGIEDRTILWNAVQLHPHPIGETQANRTPTEDELLLGMPSLQMLEEAFPRAWIIAVGKKAEMLLSLAVIPTVATLRHPANGGATLFTRGLRDLVSLRRSHHVDP